MLEEKNKMVNEITTLVNEVKYNLSKEINNKIVYGLTYTYYIPDKEQLIREVEKVLKDNEES